MALLATQRNHLPAARASRVAKSAPLSGHSAHVPVRQARRATVARVANVTDDTFSAEVLKADKTVLVDFWANWCGPCKLVAPLMDWAEKEYPDLKVVKVEHDANKKLIADHKVYGLPTLILFKDGQEVAGSHREGAVTKAMLQTYLTKHGIVAKANVSS